MGQNKPFSLRPDAEEIAAAEQLKQYFKIKSNAQLLRTCLFETYKKIFLNGSKDLEIESKNNPTPASVQAEALLEQSS